MRFDYVHDALPDAVERVRSVRIPQPLHTPFAALLTVMLIVAAWSGIENAWVRQASAEEVAAGVRLDESRAELEQTKVQRSRIDEMIALDARLRAIHLSGSQLAMRLADIANHVPSHAWLTSISRTPDGILIDGRADGLRVLSDTLADLMSSRTVASPTLVRAGREDQARVAGLISFEVRAEDRSQ